ncbi:TnsA-like heteromeric transposase endonuclease subunit [Streptomyces botrytidirepellens]|uniref:TnsA-like heteromeric transposase endonuclease subunit n=2 Tax=Streptomyces botrytidirepellens TaxID=2486417 RepID=A0A3M8VJR7_9ACTN|nr:TnsA-like heteromeric transposase endonuclease subunit [Streptomyces botrytidirepellens]
MVKDLQIVHRDGAGREVQVPVGMAAGVPLAEREPVWVPLRHPSERSIVTWWWSATSGKHVGCRSLERLSVAMLLDFNPKVADFTAWTARLEWTERGRSRRLVPDFFVRTTSGATVVVSCPPASGASSRWERQREVLQQACREAGWEMGSPRLPNKTALANLRWASRYRHPRIGDHAVERDLMQAFARPRPLLEGVQAVPAPQLLVLPRLYHLLWRRKLTIDWSVPLGPGSVVECGGSAPEAMRRPFTVGQEP